MDQSQYPTAEAISLAAKGISPYIHRTPVLTSETLDRIAGCHLWFKCENFQKAGAFKARGATYAVLSLGPEELAKGVATHSSGNHAAALALAATYRKIPAYIVMPQNSSRVKVAAVEHYGGLITFCEPTLQAREDTLRKVLDETGATEIHPYNNFRIITGQATAAKEVIGDVPGLDYIIAPVGGGGLLSGTALSARYFSGGTRVIAAEPAGADDAFRSFRDRKLIPQTNPQTVADGLRTSLGTLTFPIIMDLVDSVFTATDDQIIQAMRMVWERMKIIIEPSSAVALAVLLARREVFEGKRIGIILSGGNVDLSNLPW